MFKRKIEKELLNWKNNNQTNKKAFILKGLRQVGKTTIIKKFAEENYENVVYINFKLDARMKEAFSSDLKVNTIITYLSVQDPKFIFIPYKTVIIFDEIQECAGARAAIKEFCEDGRFDIIGSGSLLGIQGYNDNYKGGVPVGFEHTCYMYPLDFEEYLMANGINENIINIIIEAFNNKKTIPNIIHESISRMFREYICVGGMPSVVNVFLNTHDMNQVLIEQRDLLSGYHDDYGKHLDENENEKVNKTLLTKINKVFESIPSQLAKENKKFAYNLLGKKATSEMFDPAIQWLKDYGLINICYNLSNLSIPLEGNKIDNIFKIYMMDTGLLIAMLDNGTAREILSNNLGIYKGAIYENIVAQALSINGKKLYYYAKSSGLEIDFILNNNFKINLLEVKATNGNTKAANTILNDKEQYPEVNGLIKVCDANISFVDNKLIIPHYLLFLL